MEYIGTINFHEQPKLNLNETYIGQVFAENFALNFAPPTSFIISEELPGVFLNLIFVWMGN